MDKASEIKVEYLPLADLKPYDKNPRKNSPAVDPCAESIKKFGFTVPIIIDGEGVIVCGHTRRLAAMKLGLDTVPCIRRNDLSPEEIRALRLADNKIAEQSEWDDELLRAELEDLKDFDFDFEAMGFSPDELQSDFADANVEDDDFEEAEDIKEIRVHRGEIWQLGDHRLMCGDSTNAGDVEKLMGGETADLWLTDPPYNVDYHGSDGQSIQNDSMEDAKFREFLRSAFALAEKVMKPGASAYIFHADSEGYNFRGACHDVGLKVRQCLIWKKNALVLGRQDYQWIHEPCIYLWKDGGAHNWYSDRSQTTVLEFDKPRKSDLHPTMKPIALIAYLMCNSSRAKDVVLDNFGGSGTTLIAAERTGRKCRDDGTRREVRNRNSQPLGSRDRREGGKIMISVS